MPVLLPKPNEKESDFISRCISSLTKSDPDRETEQIQAMCYDSWRKDKNLAAEEFKCECIKCGYKMTSVVHCKDIKCPKCGGQMRRISRPGPGQSLESYDINDKELIAVGTWNTMDGKLTIKEEDLDAIMESYNDLINTGIRKIPIKLGHDKSQKLLQKGGYPSAGWVENLRKKTVKGIVKIIGDLKTIPSKVYKIIQNRGYVNVSPELSRNYEYLNTGKKYKWLFNKLALLGIDQPAQDLDELIEVYAKEGSGDEIVFNLADPIIDKEDIPKQLLSEKQLTKEELEMEELEKAKARIAELETGNKELQTKTKEQEEEKTKLQESLNEAEEKVTTTEKEKKETEIAAFIDGAIEKGTILPVQKDAYMEILMAMPEDKTYKFSDNGEEKEGNALDLIKSIVETMPNLVEFSEFSEQKENVTKKGTEPDGTEMDDVELAAKVEKVMLEEKIPYDEAYERLKEREEV